MEDEELDPEFISKALFHFNSILTGLMKPLRMYGQGEYVDTAQLEIVKQAWHLHWVLSGIDEPFEVPNLHW